MPLVNKDHQANPDFKDCEVIRVREGQLDPRELVDSLVIEDCRDHEEPVDRLDNPAQRESAVFQVNQETLDDLDLTELEVYLERQENRDLQEDQVRVKANAKAKKIKEQLEEIK